MSYNSQPQEVQDQEDQTVKEQPKYTVKLFNNYVPMWVVLLAVVLLAWFAWTMWNRHHVNAVGLTNSTRNNLDALAVSHSSPGVNGSAGVLLQTPNTSETVKQLNRLFNSF